MSSPFHPSSSSLYSPSISRSSCCPSTSTRIGSNTVYSVNKGDGLRTNPTPTHRESQPRRDFLMSCCFFLATLLDLPLLFWRVLYIFGTVLVGLQVRFPLGACLLLVVTLLTLLLMVNGEHKDHKEGKGDHGSKKKGTKSFWNLGIALPRWHVLRLEDGRMKACGAVVHTQK